jgi:hypothetical protein
VTSVSWNRAPGHALQPKCGASAVLVDLQFVKAMLDEAATLFLNGEPVTARLILLDLVNATVGFEQLASATANHEKARWVPENLLRSQNFLLPLKKKRQQQRMGFSNKP